MGTENGEVKVANGHPLPPVMSDDLDRKNAQSRKAAEAEGTLAAPVVIHVNGVEVGLEAQAEADPWALPELQNQVVQWSDLSLSGKLMQVCLSVLKISALLFLLYLFICSLDFLSSAFRLVGGKQAGKVFQDSNLLKNPVVGLMIGVLATVLVQSSSTSTSIVVTMVGAKLINVSNAIPIVMGANIGTSVTNTIVSLTQATDRNEFRRAFAAATVHDMFNWLTVIVLLPIEAGTGYLEYLTEVLMDTRNWNNTASGDLNKDMLKKLTKPFTNLIIQVDSKLIAKIAANQTDGQNVSFIKQCKMINGTKSCNFVMGYLDWSDSMVGLLLLILSLALLCTCLVLMVKLLHSMLRGRITLIIKRIINAEPRFPLNHLVGYVAILVGCAMTILVQSSSIFTSALTPLAGVGIISLERMYPLTLGANIGTTTTSILAALASSNLKDTLQIAFCHLFFNISGILLFYPVPFLRFPIPLAKILGNTTAQYRWFSIFYLIAMFILLPLFIFSLSIAGRIALMVIGIPLLITFFLVIIINIIQRKRPSLLPIKMRTWNWLPEFMHSLDPLDRLIIRVFGVCKCCKCCIQPQTRHDAKVLGISSNQSQMNIVETASQSNECHILNGFENKAFIWNPSGKTASESTML